MLTGGFHSLTILMFISDRQKKMWRKATDQSSKSTGSTASTISTSEIKQIVHQLELQHYHDMTRKNYYAIWKVFNNFIVKLDVKPTLWEDRLTLFVGYLVHEKRQSKTIKCYISAIKAILKENSISLSEDRYLLSSMTRACKITNDKAIIRLPIHKALLQVLVRGVTCKYMNDSRVQQPYLEVLYKAMFTTAYFGMFRVGEISHGSHVIKAKDMHIANNKPKILFVLHTLKTHGRGDKPQMVKIQALQQLHTVNRRPVCCPFKFLQDYIRIRPAYTKQDEQFFVFCNNSPVMPIHFRTVLKNVLFDHSYDQHFYNCHSFRIVRSQDLAKLGLSVDLIRRLGRWSSKSNAVYTYLK